jgi:RNA polymerase sigma-70 factor, ECF subfamily
VPYALRTQDFSPPLQSIGGILRIYRVMRAVAAEAAEANQTLRLAQAGDQDAFAALVEQHEAMVFSIALRFFADRSRAEELAQEVFVQLYRSIGEIASDEHLLFWLRQVTSRRCIDQKRRFRLRAVSLDEAPHLAAAPNFGDPLLDRKLQKLVAELPEAQRIAITLRYQEELEPQEICRLLGVPLKTVKSHLYRALQALRTKLEDC